MKNVNITQKGLILVLLPLITGLFFICSLAFLVDQAEKEAEYDARSKQLIECAQTLEICGILTNASAVVYVSTTRNASFLDEYRQSEREIRSTLKKLQKLTRSEPRKHAAVKHIALIFNRSLRISDMSIKEIQSGQMYSELGSVSRMREHLFALYTQGTEEIRQFAESEKSAGLEVRRLSRSLRATVKAILVVGVLVSIVVSIGVLLVFTRGIFSRLKIMLENIERFARGEQLKPSLEGKDEIAKLDWSFHKMVEALTESMRKERAVVNNALDVLCTLDCNLRFGSLNPATLPVWGYKPEEIEGRRIVDIIAPEDRLVAQSTLERMLEDELGPISFDCRISAGDGGIRYSKLSVDWHPEEELFFCVSHDITQRKLNHSLLRESEARSKAIVESLPLGLIIAADDGKLEVANRQAERLLNFRQNERAGKSVEPLLQSESQTEESLVSDSQPDSIRRNRRLEVQRVDGAKLSVELSSRELEFSGERKTLFVLTDVSQQARLEKMKSQFIAMVSHDMLSVVSSISNGLMLFADGLCGVPNQKGSQLLTVCQRETNRMIALVNNLLNSERLESGKLEIVKELTDISTLISQAVTAVEHLAAKGGVGISRKLQPGQACVDPDSLTQVMVNLLANAIKFSPRGSTISVDLKFDDGAVRVQVADQGCGIPPEHRQSVFERFRQVTTEDRTKKGGSGLGLAICKGIIVAHGGEIGVSGNDDGGSTFWWWVPSGKEAGSNEAGSNEAGTESGARVDELGHRESANQTGAIIDSTSETE